MEYVAVLVAATGAYAFGAVWYAMNGERWMQAAGIEKGADGEPKGAGSPMPFIISAICVILVAGMMRHIFAQAAIDTVGKGFFSGLGLGAFIVTPWIVTNYAYSMRPRMLSILDGAYAIIGCTIIGTILTLF